MAIKRNKILIYATTGMHLEKMMFSKGSQSQKITYYITPFI